MTAHDAITHSILTNDTVSLDFNECDLDALLHLTRDYVKGARQWQFWGEHEGKHWHVNVRFPIT